MQISKSEYMLFLKHPIYLWLKKYDKAKLPPVDDALQAIFEAGHVFESYAENIFNNKTRLGFEGYNEYVSLTKRTDDAIKEISSKLDNSKSQTLLQARFETIVNGASLTCICDAIDFIDKTTVDLYEIKSGTRVKQENLYDLAFQLAVLESCGFKVRDVYVINVNGQYVRSGDIDINEFCIISKVSDEVKELGEFTNQQIELAKKCVTSNIMPVLEVPDEEMGAESLNAWLELYAIFNELPKGSIFELCWPKNRVARLHEMGVVELTEIDEEFDLTPKQLLQVNAIKTGEQFIDIEQVANFINEFEYPIYFLDYETAMSVIPPFDGTSPYQQIPFQFSLHILDEPGAALRHEMYLHKENSDSTLELSKHLAKHIGNKGSIVTWNANFEKSCNTRMGIIHPEFEDFYEKVNERVVDLAIPFQQNWFVDHRFLGSYSIKKVLPVLIPELSYKDLDINEGLLAQRKWMQAVLEDKFNDVERKKVLDDLENYCELDTLAMVEIYRFLKRLID